VVKAEVASAARALLAMDCDVASSTEIAARAAAVCQQVSTHVARLVGDMGIRAMFDRSLYVAAASFTCLRTIPRDKADGPYEALRRCLEAEAPQDALAAAAHVLTTFIELLERFIGERLVANLLYEVWPTVFAAAVKETK
jgi:hypothetical protein